MHKRTIKLRHGSDRSKKTRNPGYVAGDNWLICDVCGCAVYASDALERWDGMVTCKQDWEPRHEQDFVRARKDRIAVQGLLRPEGESEDIYVPDLPDTPVPVFSTVPNFYSVTGIGGGNVVPPPATSPVSKLSADEPQGIDMNDYLLSDDILIGSWAAHGDTDYVTIDPVTGIIKGKPDAPIGRYFMKVSVLNRGGRGYTNEFDWEVLPYSGYELSWDKVTIYPEIGNMQFSRTSGAQTYLNHLAQPIQAINQQPALIGQDGPSYSVESNVGYGLDMKFPVPHTRLIARLEDVAGLPDNGMELEATAHLVFRVTEDSLPWVGGDWDRLLLLANAHLDDVPDDPYGRKDFSEIAIFTGNSENSLSVSYRTRNTDDTDPMADFNGFYHMETPTLPLQIGSIIDIRFKINNQEGGKLWVRVDGALLVDGLTNPLYPPPIDRQIVAIDALGIAGSPYHTIYEMNITCVYTRIIASGYVEETDLLSWPEWQHPLPIIVTQPVAQTVSSGEEATFTTTIQHPYPTYQWLMDDVPAGQDQNSLTILTSTPGSYSIKCNISNPGGAIVTTNTVTLTVV